ncbi:hypothetical protein TREAZ_1861 [Leadbettera azotonutricia ZAS-9]|uniref:Uncharacterized protein n=2 Tax=Leadbettera azotonutricia TaxID=150829 RepID=F5YBE7_LEAAZ|nr:hypothetical protein TREAZ_1861 [Leadbettera azotonutricia ZAS-9]
MAYTVIYEGIIFVEGDFPGAERGAHISCDLSFKIGAQLKSLRDVKNNLASKARSKGANAILDFTYGQKSRWLALDDIAFWGKGCLAVISDEDFKRIEKAGKD